MGATHGQSFFLDEALNTILNNGREASRSNNNLNELLWGMTLIFVNYLNILDIITIVVMHAYVSA